MTSQCIAYGESSQGVPLDRSNMGPEVRTHRPGGPLGPLSETHRVRLPPSPVSLSREIDPLSNVPKHRQLPKGRTVLLT